jgi:CubicO group peptidase (beta-lactamase class C family)
MHRLQGAFIFSFVLLPFFFGASAGQSTSPTQRTKQVDALFADFDKKGSPGCALAIIQDGRITYQRGYGMADLDYDAPITPASVFYIASDSKQFTAFSVALLVEQGKVSLDDPVTKYFPELPKAVYGGVTVGHLIHHTGGVRDYWPLIELAGNSVDDELTDDDFIALMARQKALNFSPGERYEYSNSGYVLLAILVKRVSGESLAEFASANIFRPLGMSHTFFRDDPSVIVKERATGYDYQQGGYREHTTNSRLVGDGGLMTTVGDLFLWDQNFYHNRLGKGSPDLIKLVETVGTLNSGKKTNYAFGLAVTEYMGLRTITHNGSAFGYKADMTRFPEQNFSVVCLCNTDAPKMAPWAFRRQIADLYLADKFKTGPAEVKAAPPQAASNAGAKEAPIRLTEQELARYAGTFRDRTEGEVWKLSAEAGRLVASVEGITFHLEPLSRTHFRATGAPQPVELYFPADLSSPPKVVELQVGSQPRSRLEAFVVWTPTAAELAGYTGDYYSEELDATFHIYTDGGQLRVRRKHSDCAALLPGLKDNFEMGRAKLGFGRAASGRVSGFRLSDEGANNIQFVKK